MSSSHLLDLQQLDVKGQLRVSRDAGLRLAAVGKVCGNGETTLATNSHALDADIPALNDLATTGSEGERLALLVGYETLDDNHQVGA